MDYTQIIITIITAVLAPLAIYIAQAVVEHLKTKTADVKLQSVLADVSASIDTSYAVWQKAFAEAKTRLSADGTFDNTDLDAAIKEAAKAAAETITMQTMAYLETNGIDLAKYLTNKIKARMEANTNA